MQDEKLTSFNLVGGTALALFMGHRKSIDLDLFSQQEFNVDELEEHLRCTYGFQTGKKSNATLIGYVNKVKIDCIRYNYPLVQPLLNKNHIRMVSKTDIAAMKLTAISQNGTRLKDFVDIAFLSAEISLNQMLDAYEKKYPNTHKMLALKGLIYFNDIDFSTRIELTDGIFKWKNIEKRLNEMIKYPNRVFLTYPVTNERNTGVGVKR
jgi:hypothetical protein